MTPAAQESFNQSRKFKAVKKHAKRWSSKKNGASSSSKKERLASPDIENADQFADVESDNDLQLAGAASSSKQGGDDISWQAR